jgi:hypothetical protein
MRSILQEIKEQPPHIREMFMWVCVVITFSVIGFAWFKTTSIQFVALLNPGQIEETRALAQKEEPSPFATLYLSFKDLTANIVQLFDFSKTNDLEINNSIVLPPAEINQPIISPQKMPLSGEK